MKVAQSEVVLPHLWCFAGPVVATMHLPPLSLSLSETSSPKTLASPRCVGTSYGPCCRSEPRRGATTFRLETPPCLLRTAP
jgi:hypothetical protein